MSEQCKLLRSRVIAAAVVAAPDGGGTVFAPKGRGAQAVTYATGSLPGRAAHRWTAFYRLQKHRMNLPFSRWPDIRPTCGTQRPMTAQIQGAAVEEIVALRARKVFER